MNTTLEMNPVAQRVLVAQRLRRQAAARLQAPLTCAQEQIWFHHQLGEAGPTYNLPAAFRLVGGLDSVALQNALDRCLVRQAALRTRLAVEGDRPVQLIGPPAPVPVCLIDLSWLPAEERAIKARRMLESGAQEPFDLAQGSPLRVVLLRLAPREHWLLLVVHHLVADAWSMSLLCRELAGHYTDFVHGTPTSLPKLPAQYADYARGQQQWLRGPGWGEELAYWRAQLAGELAVLELPTDQPRSAVQTFNGAVQSLTLPAGLTESLAALNQREGVTPFMTLLAVFQTLLHRYTGQTEILVGSPVSGRNRVEWESVMGLFVNTLVLRTNLGGRPTFRELLARVREVVLGALAHAEMPFDRLVRELQPKRSANLSPLVQVLFAMQNTPGLDLRMPGVEAIALEVDTHTAKFDLSWFVTASEDRLNCQVEYNTDLFESETIRRMLGHFQVLLEELTTNPDLRISDAPLLTASECQQIVVEWNRTGIDWPQVKCVHQLFEDQAARTPDAVALDFQGQQLTYGELNRRANQLALHLRALGIGPEGLVGICLERSPEMVVGLLGILKAGGAYVPIDPAYPQERLRLMLEDSQVPVLLTQQKWLSRLAGWVGRVICLDTEWEAIGRQPASNPAVGLTLDNLMYVIYTSGSTGQPKGALNTHRALCNRLLWMQATYPLTDQDRVLQKTPITFDVSVWEFFWPLLAGARLVVARPGGHQDSAYLVDLILSQGITTLHFVPSMLRAFLEQPGVADCTSLRRVFCSGEALDFELQQRFFERLDCELHNLYGPTEAAVDVTAWSCQRAGPSRLVPIGRPIANLQTYILDPTGQPMPVGVPGELYLGGIGVGRGYWRRPELTRERFLPNLFRPEPEARLYRTGDRARYLPDGNIEFLGRLDDQVKIRGQRVELEEIQIHLSQHPAVREAAVLLREDRPGDPRLVAYYVPHADREVSAADLRELLRAKLPEVSVPAAYVRLASLPVTPNGKLDRRALPLPDSAATASTGQSVAPRSPTETALANMWAEVLSQPAIGVTESFFDLGGHSLLLARVLARVRQAYDIELPLPRVFQRPTVAAMATLLEQALADQISQMSEVEAQRLTGALG